MAYTQHYSLTGAVTAIEKGTSIISISQSFAPCHNVVG
jgi:hypothetical protein